VQVANNTDAMLIESSIKMSRVILSTGRNGNLYIGSFRGTAVIHDIWSMYSGQAITDASILLACFDVRMDNFVIGGNVGVGLYLSGGPQFWITNGAIFLNGQGLTISGDLGDYITLNNINIQWNTTTGVYIRPDVSYPGHTSGGIICSGFTFDGNSFVTPGLHSDIFIDDNRSSIFVSPIFTGAVATPGVNYPRYNIQFDGVGLTTLVGVVQGNGQLNDLGFTNNYAAILGVTPAAILQDAYHLPRWVPVLSGTGGGPATYSISGGTFSRAGALCTVSGTIVTSGLGAITGPVKIGPLPIFSANDDNGTYTCAIIHTGWTGAAGHTTLLGNIVPNSDVLQLIAVGTGEALAAVDAAELATVTTLKFCITYLAADKDV
jgi:hypothetical protein